MDRLELIAEKNAEIEVLARLSLTEVTPSRRDFAMFVATHKDGIALVPRLKRADPETGGSWPGLDITALARVCDDGESPAIAVATAGWYGGSIGDLQAVAEAVSAPVLRDDLCLHPNQAYQARLHGADAVVIPAWHLTPEQVEELTRIAGSVHMAAVIEVGSAAELKVGLSVGKACIGLRCPRPDGRADLDQAHRLAESIPPARTVLLLSEVESLDALRSLDGVIDAAVVGNALLDASDPAALVRSWAS
jgi:indole-3-glycerol phosphate synthase